MRWEDERYVRLYTRDTLDWQALSFEAQGLFSLILRKVDRAGILRLGKHGKRGVAVAVGHGHRWDALEPALEELLQDGCVAIRGADLLIPNFIAAQEAQASDKARQALKRERDRDKVAAQGMGHLSDEAKDQIAQIDRAMTADADVTPTVTESSHTGGVTQGCHAGAVTQERHAGDVTPSRAVPSQPSKSFAGAVAPPAPVPVGAPPGLPVQLEAAGLSVPSPEPVSVDQPPLEDDDPEGPDNWRMPWGASGAPRLPGKSRPNKYAGLLHWMLWRMEERTERQDVAWDKAIPILKQRVDSYDMDRVRKGWLCWLMDPWAASLSPPYCVEVFLTKEQTKKQVARADRFEWEVSKYDPDDWDLPWLIDEAEVRA